MKSFVESVIPSAADIQSRPAWRRYGVAVVVVALATALRMLLDPWLGDSHYFTFYYAAVALVTWYSGPLPAVLALIAGLILGDWFFEEPRYALGQVTIFHWASYWAFILTSAVIVAFSRLSHLAYQAEQLRASEALNRRLAEADEHKNRFLAMLGHELRNPLAGIVNGAQALKMIGLDTDAETMRAVIDRQAGHMERLVDDLLDISRVSRGKILLRREPCDLVALVRRTVDAYAAQPEAEHVHLTSNFPDHALWIDADPTRIAQVLTNLLGNAAKFTDAGGTITVTLAEPRRGWARLCVRDTGIGMEPEVLQGVFEPFWQIERSVPRSRGGLGLGLALVKGLVELHGGEVWASSPGSGNGSEFCVRLPLLARDVPKAAAAESAPAKARAYRILLIDDRRDVIVPLKKMLELEGQTVAVAADGLSGLELARQFRPEIVFCDIGLPDIDGYAVAEQMRADPDLKSAHLIALTGYGREEDRRRAMEAGFDYHVIKPVGKQQLDALLAELPRFDPAEVDLPASR